MLTRKRLITLYLRSLKPCGRPLAKSRGVLQHLRLMRHLVVLLAFSTLTLSAQQPQARQVAGLEQDIAELRTEVAKVAQQLNDLQAEVANLRKRPASAPNTDRETLLAEVDRRQAGLRADLDRAFATFTKQVNQALAARTPVGSPGSQAPTVTATAPVSPATPAATAAAPELPSDMPRTGIRYKVRPGDTVSAIARRNNSKVEWILKANQMDNPNALRVDDEIFLPQP